MNRQDLIDEIATETGVNKKDVTGILDATFESITKAVAAGEEVRLTGFGTFSRVERAARTARNPRTGEAIQVEASFAPKFKVGKGFKDAVKA